MGLGPAPRGGERSGAEGRRGGEAKTREGRKGEEGERRKGVESGGEGRAVEWGAGAGIGGKTSVIFIVFNDFH